MKVLTHICCGPCAIYPVEVMRQAGHVLQGFFYNPNIHPYQEYRRRLETLAQWAAQIDLPMTFAAGYDLEEFFRAAVFREDRRCLFCYHLRLNQTAQVARREGFPAITTTLLYSRYQKHDLILEIGREAARSNGVEFFYQDFRVGWSEGVKRSKELGMYRQKYCGCLYSERERFFERPPVNIQPDQAVH